MTTIVITTADRARLRELYATATRTGSAWDSDRFNNAASGAALGLAEQVDIAETALVDARELARLGMDPTDVLDRALARLAGRAA